MDEGGRRAVRASWHVIAVAAAVGALSGAAAAGLWLSTPGPAASARALPLERPADRPALGDTAADGTPEATDASAARIVTLRSELDDLRARLEAETAAREQLARRLRQLANARPTGADEAAGEPSADADRAAASGGPPPFFDGGALVALGVSQADVAWLHELHDDFEMQQLELADRATREGWFATPRYFQEHTQQLAALREELGDEVYDLVLYAAGENNRVIVGDVLQSSPAERAGLEPGDVVLGYDGRRIFNGTELRGATAEGERGELVAVDVLRDGRPRRIIVPRGPLGVRVRTERQPPLRGP
jgi:hypothetical protein